MLPVTGVKTDDRELALFLIFDYCGNFEYFRTKPNGYEGAETKTLSENIFGKKVRLAAALQEAGFSEEEYQNWRSEIVKDCHERVTELNTALVSVHLKLQYVEKYRNIEAFAVLGEGAIGELITHVAPLVNYPDKDEYAKRTGNKPAGVSISVDNDTMTAEIELVSDMDTVLDCYKIDVRTGIGTDSSGHSVDLSVYAKPEKTFFASVKELGNMAKIDYEKKTGTACYVTEAVLSEDKTTVTVKLTDANGKLLETYIIDPYTGEGKADSGAAVNLPQTGVTSPKTAAAAAEGLLMLVSGLFTMMKSGMFRKKDE